MNVPPPPYVRAGRFAWAVLTRQDQGGKLEAVGLGLMIAAAAVFPSFAARLLWGAAGLAIAVGTNRERREENAAFDAAKTHWAEPNPESVRPRRIELVSTTVLGWVMVVMALLA